MVNFVYLKYHAYSFFGIEESRWVNLSKYINLQCNDIITAAFHNIPKIYQNVPELKNVQSVNPHLNSDWMIDALRNIDLHYLTSLVYYCDNDGLDDKYFSDLVFKGDSNSHKILKDLKLSDIFGIDIPKIKEKNASKMNLFLLIAPYYSPSPINNLLLINYDYLNLKAIKFNKTKHSSLISSSFKDTRYNVNNNQLEYFHSETITSDIATVINLSSNKIDSIEASTFDKFKTLRGLYLNGNRLETLSLDLSCLASLQELNLSNNGLKTIEFRGNSGGILAKLSLQNNFIDDTEKLCAQIKNLTNLQELYLHENKLKSIKAIKLQKAFLISLEVFHLYGNHFSESDLKELEDIFSWKDKKEKMGAKKLQNIRVQFTGGDKITDERFNEIQASIHRNEKFIISRISSNLKGITIYFLCYFLSKSK